MNLEYIAKDSKYQNINQILKQEFHISARLLHKLIISQHISLNSHPVDTRSCISNGDIITVNLDFEEESENIVATQMSLDIIYEDDALLILNKPSGITVHPSILHYQDSLSLSFAYQLTVGDLIHIQNPLSLSAFLAGIAEPIGASVFCQRPVKADDLRFYSCPRESQLTLQGGCHRFH